MKKKKDEIVDLSSLPSINIFSGSLLLEFKNTEKRFKILENIFKNSEKQLKFISREQIIEYAKENKIYIDPEEGKKQNPKDPPIEKREINSGELAKSASGLILEKSIPAMKDKKTLLERIEELRKQKEELINFRDNPPVIDPKAKLKANEKKKEIINPEEIIIPSVDEMGTDIIILFYNYPMNVEEYQRLVEEKVILNNICLVKEIDELTEELRDEVQLDKNGKPIGKPKDQKVSNDLLQMQKYFQIPNNDGYTIYNDLLKAKRTSDKHSPLRLTFFETVEFSYKINEESKKDTIISFQEDYVIKMCSINKYFLHFKNWLATTIFEKFSRDTKFPKDFSNSKDIISVLEQSDFEYKDFEHISYGSLLYAFSLDRIKTHRRKNENVLNNKIIFEKNNIDALFEKLENEIIYEYEKKNIESNYNKSNEIDDKIEEKDNNKTPISHYYAEIARESEEVEKKNILCDNLSSPFKLIIDENDLILKSTLDNKSISDKLSLDVREKYLNIFRAYPGIGRYQMPAIAPIEENKRKAIKCEIYPFLEDGVDIPIYEKYEIINQFEKILNEKIPEKNFDFGDRIYHEVMDRDVLTQSINQALLYDSESIYFYNQRDDNTLLITYYKCPKGRLYRKTNKYKYLSKPDFENWVKYFRPVFNSRKNSEENSTNSKNNLHQNNKISNNIHNVIPTEPEKSINTGINKESESIKYASPYNPNNDILYEADDTYLGEVTEKIKYMFPSDNGLFIRKIIENGIFTSHSSYVKKDHLIFGIRKNAENISEFWLRFENDVLLTCNYIGTYDPLIIGQETEPVTDIKNGTYTNISFKNGLIIQILPDGDICQRINKPSDTKDSKLTDEEIYRIYTSKASVVTNSPFKTIIMYANGNVCNIQNDLAVNTNNKGYRTVKRLNDGVTYEIDSIPVTIQSDPESHTKTLIRDDKLINIKYPDNSSLTIHSDETKIYTYPDQKTYLIENENYATVEIQYDPVKKRTKTVIAEGSTEALLGSDNLMIRSYDGRLSKITLPDRTLVYTLKEKKETNEFEKYTYNTVTFIYRPDGTVVRVQQDGDIAIITSEERMYYNNKGQNLDFIDKDVDYLFELNTSPEERGKGVYTVNLIKSKIYTCDDEKNIFEVHADGTAKCKITKNMNLEESLKKIDEINCDSPRYTTEDYIDPQVIYLEPPSNFISPRLFVIENDNSGYELLSESQIRNFRRLKLRDKLHTKYYCTDMQEGNFISHYWITKYKSVAEKIKETHVINSIRIPKKLEKITQTPLMKKYPDREIYFYRNLIQSKIIDNDLREKIALSLRSKDEWFNKRKVDFGVVQVNISDIQDNTKIQRRILIERQTPDTKFQYDTIKNNLMNMTPLREDIEPIEPEFMLNKKSILFDIEHYINELEQKKLIEDRSFRKLPMNLDIHGTLQEILASIHDEGVFPKMKKKQQSIDMKALQELKFLNNYFASELGKDCYRQYLYSDSGKEATLKYPIRSKFIGEKKQKEKLNENQGISDEFVDEVGPYTIDTILNNMQMKSDLDANNYDLKQQSPIVFLDNEKLSVNETNEGITSKTKKKMLPSIHRKKLQKIREIDEKNLENAEKWHKMKNSQYSHDGRSPRVTNPLVPNYLKTTFPEAVINEDYIYVEKITDKRVQTSSVAKRLYFNAPSINEIRKSGQHNFLIKALDSRKTYEEMMERLNLMITSELCDPFNKMLKIDPIQLNFGYLKIGVKYEMILRIRNDDNISNRVQIRKHKNSLSSSLGIEYFIGGTISPGETKKVKVILQADIEIIGKFTEIIEVQTKSFIYKIPVSAMVITAEEFDRLNTDSLSKKNIKLEQNATLYKKEYPPIPRKKKLKQIATDTDNRFKNRNLPNPFDTASISKYLEIPKDSINNSSYQDDKLPVI